MLRARKIIVATRAIEDPTPTVIARFELVFSASMTADQIVIPPTKVNGVKRASRVAR